MILTLEFIINTLAGKHYPSTTPITGGAFDSRLCEPGSLFVALPGETGTDGHQYTGAAFANGAIAALVRRTDLGLDAPVLDLRDSSTLPDTLPVDPCLLLVEDPLLALQAAARAWFSRWAALPDHHAIGITGSVGKTTTKEAVYELLTEKYLVLKSEKSFNNEIGLPLTVLNLRDDHQRAVLEMSMYVPGEIGLLCQIAPPKVGVMTLIAPVHLERAKTLQAIIDGKAELIEALPPDGTAILNGDDPNVLPMANRTTARVITFGEDPAHSVWADEVIILGLQGIRFRLHHGEDSRIITTPMPGAHSVYTALSAAAVGFVEGLSWDQVQRGLEKPRALIRLITIRGPQGCHLIDDTYNASPDSVIAALNLMGAQPGAHLAILGDMRELGDYEAEGHRRVGEQAARTAEALITVGERGRLIAEAAAASGLAAERIQSYDRAEDAAMAAREWITPETTVLVKGSRAVGMERIVRLLSEQA